MRQHERGREETDDREPDTVGQRNPIGNRPDVRQAPARAGREGEAAQGSARPHAATLHRRLETAPVRARLGAVAAELHRAPRARTVRRAVVERPAAVAAGLEPRPGAVEHRTERDLDDPVELILAPPTRAWPDSSSSMRSRAAAALNASTAPVSSGSALFATTSARRDSRSACARPS